MIRVLDFLILAAAVLEEPPLFILSLCDLSDGHQMEPELAFDGNRAAHPSLCRALAMLFAVCQAHLLVSGQAFSEESKLAASAALYLGLWRYSSQEDLALQPPVAAIVLILFPVIVTFGQMCSTWFALRTQKSHILPLMCQM